MGHCLAMVFVVDGRCNNFDLEVQGERQYTLMWCSLFLFVVEMLCSSLVIFAMCSITTVAMCTDVGHFGRCCSRPCCGRAVIVRFWGCALHSQFPYPPAYCLLPGRCPYLPVYAILRYYFQAFLFASEIANRFGPDMSGMC